MVKLDVLESGVRCAAPEGPTPGVTMALPVIFIVAKPPPPRGWRVVFDIPVRFQGMNTIEIYKEQTG